MNTDEVYGSYFFVLVFGLNSVTFSFARWKDAEEVVEEEMKTKAPLWKILALRFEM